MLTATIKSISRLFIIVFRLSSLSCASVKDNKFYDRSLGKLLLVLTSWTENRYTLICIHLILDPPCFKLVSDSSRILKFSWFQSSSKYSEQRSIENVHYSNQNIKNIISAERETGICINKNFIGAACLQSITFSFAPPVEMKRVWWIEGSPSFPHSR